MALWPADSTGGYHPSGGCIQSRVISCLFQGSIVHPPMTTCDAMTVLWISKSSSEHSNVYVFEKAFSQPLRIDDEHTLPNSTELGDVSLTVEMSEDSTPLDFTFSPLFTFCEITTNPCCKFKNMGVSIGKDAIDGPAGARLLEWIVDFHRSSSQRALMVGSRVTFWRKVTGRFSTDCLDFEWWLTGKFSWSWKAQGRNLFRSIATCRWAWAKKFLEGTGFRNVYTIVRPRQFYSSSKPSYPWIR